MAVKISFASFEPAKGEETVNDRKVLVYWVEIEMHSNVGSKGPEKGIAKTRFAYLFTVLIIFGTSIWTAMFEGSHNLDKFLILIKSPLGLEK
jgi:hypothetical protein